MRRIAVAFAVSLWVVMLTTAAVATGDKVAVLDDCDSTDSAWASVGGCTLQKGAVTFAEFNAFLPLGHPAWRFEPMYIKVEPFKEVEVRNNGGRGHTFTRVAAYGGGFVPVLNNPPTSSVIPECAGGLANPAVAGTFLAPDARLTVSGLTEGTHRFQCCIHPWMRAAIKVIPEN